MAVEGLNEFMEIVEIGKTVFDTIMKVEQGIEDLIGSVQTGISVGESFGKHLAPSTQTVVGGRNPKKPKFNPDSIIPPQQMLDITYNIPRNNTSVPYEQQFQGAQTNLNTPQIADPRQNVVYLQNAIEQNAVTQHGPQKRTFSQL